MNTDTTTLKGIEQGRAEFAYDKAKKGSELRGNKPKEYKSYAKKIPMMIKTNGLGATLAFLGSKSKDKNGRTAYGVLLEHIYDWLKKDTKPLYGDISPVQDSVDLPGYVVRLESPQYRALTIEVLAFINWVKRFADGMIEGEAADED